MALVALSLMADAWAIGVGLSASFVSATATEVERVLLRLLARLGVNGNLAYRHPAIGAGVGALEASVMHLYGVVVLLGRWVRGCARLCGVHSLTPFLWAGSRGVGDSRGAICVLAPSIILLYNRPCQKMIRRDHP